MTDAHNQVRCEEMDEASVLACRYTAIQNTRSPPRAQYTWYAQDGMEQMLS
ncbi:hypothetical protein [Methanolobus sp. WCC5]|uniref:hypothetical protein n=1 Tax=Methanolobus sp. WCC5 TaxID=3125785 RepID=UPI00324931D6